MNHSQITSLALWLVYTQIFIKDKICTNVAARVNDKDILALSRHLHSCCMADFLTLLPVGENRNILLLVFDHTFLDALISLDLKLWVCK